MLCKRIVEEEILHMYENIINEINKQNWDMAKQELNNILETMSLNEKENCDDILCILRFFTLESIVTLFRSCDLEIKDFVGIPSITEKNEQILDKLRDLFKLPSKNQFIMYQYVFSASKQH